MLTSISDYSYQYKNGDTQWKDVSLERLQHELYRYHNRTAPCIRRMLHGEILYYAGRSFRITVKVRET